MGRLRVLVIGLACAIAAAPAAPAAAASGTSPDARRMRACVVPRVRPGISLRRARRVLRRHHCRPGRVVYRADIHLHPNTVIRLRTRPGAIRRRGARIGIVLARVPPPTASLVNQLRSLFSENPRWRTLLERLEPSTAPAVPRMLELLGG